MFLNGGFNSVDLFFFFRLLCFCWAFRLIVIVSVWLRFVVVG